MEVIHKIIGLEDYTSRIPANVPPCDPELYCRFKDGLDGDWGMFPQSIILPDWLVKKVADSGDLDVNIPVVRGGDEYYPNQPYSEHFLDYVDEMHKNNPDNEKYKKCYYVWHNNLYEYDVDSVTDKLVKVLSYRTLHKWFKFFHFYNEAFLMGYGNKTFSSAKERYDWDVAHQGHVQFQYSTADIAMYDQLFKDRGGFDMMNWLFTDVFGMRKVVLSDWKAYYDLAPHFMFWGQIRQWKAWFHARYDKYKDLRWEQCKDDAEDCCDCREWFRRGGNDMYDWLKAQEEPDDIEPMCIDGTINLRVLLIKKIGDLGLYSPMITDFSTTEAYSYMAGDEVVFDDHVYRLEDDRVDTEDNITAAGIRFSKKYKEKIFGNLNPDAFDTEDFIYPELPESDWLWNRIDGEKMQVNNGRVISGLTTSKLDTLRDILVSTDDMGNTLEGVLYNYESDDQSDVAETVFIQPEEGTQLDLYWHVGNVYELEPEAGGVIADPSDNSISHRLYWGDIITKMEFYMKDVDGNRINVLSGKEDLFMGANDSNLPAIRRCLTEQAYWRGETIDNFETALDFSTDGNSIRNEIYCDIEYTVGGIIDYTFGVKDGVEFSYYKKLDEKAPYNPYKYKVGVEYSEKAVLQPNTQFYQTNDGAAILLYYWKLLRPTAMVGLDDSNNSAMEYAANFKVWTYCNEDNDYNGITTLRMIRREQDLHLPMRYTETSDIYIDRGIKSALDVNLKLQEVRSVEALEQYGNGSIPMSES